jgi:hypothetical protein
MPSVPPTPTVDNSTSVLSKPWEQWFSKFRNFFKIIQFAAFASAFIAIFIQIIGGSNIGLTCVIFGVGELIATTLYFGIGTIVHAIVKSDEAPTAPPPSKNLFGSFKKK